MDGDGVTRDQELWKLGDGRCMLNPPVFLAAITLPLPKGLGETVHGGLSVTMQPAPVKPTSIGHSGNSSSFAPSVSPSRPPTGKTRNSSTPGASVSPPTPSSGKPGPPGASVSPRTGNTGQSSAPGPPVSPPTGNTGSSSSSGQVPPSVSYPGSNANPDQVAPSVSPHPPGGPRPLGRGQ
jgi:hypothetical protein